MPPTLGTVLHGIPILSRLPASVLGFYADPEKGALRGYLEQDKDVMAKIRLQSGEILQNVLNGGGIAAIDAEIEKVAGDKVEPEVKMQYYKFVVKGWRKWMTERSPAASMMKAYKKANAIKDPVTRVQAMDCIRRAMETDD